MAEKRIVVPEEMLKAAIDRMEMPNTEPYRVQVGKALEAALRWLAENPIVPSDEWIAEYASCGPAGFTWLKDVIFLWQQRMFLVPSPEVPEAVKDLPCAGANTVKEAYFRPDIYNERILEAYRRGKEGR